MIEEPQMFVIQIITITDGVILEQISVQLWLITVEVANVIIIVGVHAQEFKYFQMMKTFIMVQLLEMHTMITPDE